MFDDKTKLMSDQILEEMVRHGYDKDAIEYARIQIKDKGDLKFAMNLVKTLARLEIGTQIFDELALRNSGDVKR